VTSDGEVAQSQGGAGRSAGAIVVALLAIIAVFAIAGIKAGEVTATVPLRPSFVSGAFRYMLVPFLIVITLIATGFPRLGDLAAIVVGCWVGWWPRCWRSSCSIAASRWWCCSSSSC
jgi:hypothetical protein